MLNARTHDTCHVFERYSLWKGLRLVLVAVFIIPALCMLTGFSVYQLFSPRQLRLEAPAGLIVIGLTGMLVLGWSALILAEFGLFSAAVLAIFCIVLGMLGALDTLRRGLRISLSAPRRRAEVVFLIGLIGLTGILYLRPHEFIFGGADAGVYVNQAAQLARSGSWLITNPDLADIAVDDYAMLFREHPPGFIPRYIHLPGFYVSDDSAANITPQFYPLHTIWLAIAHGLGGVWASLFMLPLWAILGVLALYFVVREAFDNMWLAGLAASLLAITATQIWFSRYPTAEVLTQFLLLAGLYAFTRHVRRGEGWAAIIAGLALGQSMLVRPDLYFLLGLLPVYAAYLRLQRRLDRRFWLLALPMLLMSLHSVIHAVWQGWPYLYNTYFAGGQLLPVSPLILLAGLLVTIVGFFILDRFVANNPDWQVRILPMWRSLRMVVMAVLILLALYAYFLLPLQADPERFNSYWYGGNDIPNVEPFNFVRLGWYLSPLGLLTGVLGIALIVRDDISERTWLLVGLGVFFSMLFLYRTFNNPHHIYVMRRYVPIVIPTFALGIAYTLQRLASWRWAGRTLAIGLAIVQIGLMLYADRVVVRQVNYQNGIEQFSAFAQQIPSNAIVLINDDAPVGTAGILGTPLAYLEGHTVLDLQENRIDPLRLDRLVERWLAEERMVVVVDGPSRVDGFCSRWRCRLLGRAQFDMPVLESSYEHFPTAIIRLNFSVDIFSIEAVQS